jgi:hypothetical protein
MTNVFSETSNYSPLGRNSIFRPLRHAGKMGADFLLEKPYEKSISPWASGLGRERAFTTH